MISTLPSLASLVNRLHPHTRGWLAEKLAALYLLAYGFTPIRRPHRAPVQTDLLLARGKLVLLVEVKFRQIHLNALQAITPNQKARLRAEARRISARYPTHTLRVDGIQVFPHWPFLHHTPVLIPLDGTP
ncbi:MAG: YraN family protein [Alphaproteobacteria bacterium]